MPCCERPGAGAQLAWMCSHARHAQGSVCWLAEAVPLAASLFSYAEAWITNGTVPTALVKNLAGSWVGPSSKVSTLALNLPNTLASPAWANVSFPNSGNKLPTKRVLGSSVFLTWGECASKALYEHHKHPANPVG